MHILVRRRPVPDNLIADSIAVVRLPAEIDSSNAEHVRQRLCAAITPGVRVVVADLAGTTFCDVAGVRGLARARARATTRNAEMRLAVPPGPVRRVFTLVSPGGSFSSTPTRGKPRPAR